MVVGYEILEILRKEKSGVKYEFQRCRVAYISLPVSFRVSVIGFCGKFLLSSSHVQASSCSAHPWAMAEGLLPALAIVTCCVYSFMFINLIHQRIYSLMLGSGLFFSLVIFYIQTIGLLWQVISPSQGRCLHAGQHKHSIRTHRHPCLGVGFETTIPASERAKTVYPRPPCMLGWSVDNELEKVWQEAVVACLKLPKNFPGWTRSNTKNVTQDGRCCGRDSNGWPPKYVTVAVTLRVHVRNVSVDRCVMLRSLWQMRMNYGKVMSFREITDNKKRHLLAWRLESQRRHCVTRNVHPNLIRGR
jgi:hypothetical protein